MTTDIKTSEGAVVIRKTTFSFLNEFTSAPWELHQQQLTELAQKVYDDFHALTKLLPSYVRKIPQLRHNHFLAHVRPNDEPHIQIRELLGSSAADENRKLIYEYGTRWSDAMEALISPAREITFDRHYENGKEHGAFHHVTFVTKTIDKVAEHIKERITESDMRQYVALKSGDRIDQVPPQLFIYTGGNGKGKVYLQADECEAALKNLDTIIPGIDLHSRIDLKTRDKLPLFRMNTPTWEISFKTDADRDYVADRLIHIAVFGE